MKHLVLFFIGIVALSFNYKLKAQTGTNTLPALFFNADIKNFDSTLITYYKANKNLTYFYVNSLFNSPGGQSNGNDESFHKFFFRHPFHINEDSVSGYLFIETRKTKGIEKITFLTLTYDKLNEKRATSLFNHLFKIFSEYYTKNESELRLGIRNDAKHFNFRPLKLRGDLVIKTISQEPEYNVILTLFSK